MELFLYLIGSCMVQSGLLTDRSRNLRETIEYISAKEELHNHSINVIEDNLNIVNSNSKLIKIVLVLLGLNLVNFFKILYWLRSKNYFYSQPTTL